MEEDPRHRTIRRLPGGLSSGGERLQLLVELSTKYNSPDKIASLCQTKFDLSESAIYKLINTLTRPGFLRIDEDGNINPDPELAHHLHESRGSLEFKRRGLRLLDNDTLGVFDVLFELFATDLKVEDLNEILTNRYTVDWSTTQQTKRRIDWLRILGLVEKPDGSRHYRLSEDGVQVVLDWCVEGVSHPRQIVSEFDEYKFAVLETQDRLPQPRVNGALRSVHSVELSPNSPHHNYRNEKYILILNIDGKFYGFGALSGTPGLIDTSVVDISYQHFDYFVGNEADDGMMIENELAREILRSGSITFDNAFADPSDLPMAGITGDKREETGLDNELRVEKDKSDSSSTKILESENGEKGPERTPQRKFADWDPDVSPFGGSVGASAVYTESLHFSNQSELVGQILTALQSGDHVILVGPPGTGKSELAKQICNTLVGDQFEMVTATADWSTFDTIGGYRPDRENDLQFHAGVFLQRFQSENGDPQNEWLVVDEINRADIDKAFGSLFSAIVGDSVKTPFTIEDEEEEKVAVEILGPDDDHKEIHEARYYIPEDWRMIATMNTYDKTSLYEMSYAFMRRFAFIHVNPPTADDIDQDLLDTYADIWDVDPGELAEPLVTVWETIQPERALGPAMFERVLRYNENAPETDLTKPLTMYVIPQLEGLQSRTQVDLVNELRDVDLVEGEELVRFASDYFGISADRFENDDDDE